ncbi:MAG: aminotransferase class I/II-fold pyridoxal phosphate-dependent enzyme [Gammaproteobacteria bacterium]|nr:aminotransferase class I/II-fold pyridoxal phosphate-dependent enzyme [Gammaproteobacteria bacterium]
MLAHDRFGNVIDRTVGYARGTILASSLEESQRRAHALELIRRRIEDCGRHAIFNFTGHRRGFLARCADLGDDLAEEWVGSALVEERLAQLARVHFGASDNDHVALFNRSAAGIIALLLALVPESRRVLAVAPRRRTHPSVRRGIALARAVLDEHDPEESLRKSQFLDTKLVVITRVTSELDIMPPDAVATVIAAAHEAGVPVFVDDAYGTRVAPILLAQPKSLTTGADVAITSCDKAALGGPRAGLMVGSADLVERALAKASEMGLEARGPLMLGVLRALEGFAAQMLRDDADMAKEITVRLRAKFRTECVLDLPMGPTISEEDILSIALDTGQRIINQPILVPAEATCLLGMSLLERHGILTSNVAERPGARPSLRLRPTAEEVKRFGGPQKVVDTIADAFAHLRRLIEDVGGAKRMILGPN